MARAAHSGAGLGLIFACVWIVCLALAFAVYPRPDNLITGYVVFAAFGVDALGRMAAGTAIGIGAAEVLIAYTLGYVIGRRRSNGKRRGRDA